METGRRTRATRSTASSYSFTPAARDSDRRRRVPGAQETSTEPCPGTEETPEEPGAWEARTWSPVRLRGFLIPEGD